MATSKLVVEVKEAKKLLPRRNTCVELVFGGQRYHTSVKENEMEPVWYERFFFDVSDPSNLTALALEAHVYDVQPRSNASKSIIGMVKLDGASIRSGNSIRRPSGHWYQLEPSGNSIRRPSGELCLEVYIDSTGASRHPPSLRIKCFPRLRTVLVQQEEDQSTRPRDIPLSDLKNITDNFSADRILGEGGFGVVYKGVLQNGKSIAVKKNTTPLKPDVQKIFQNEVTHLMMVNHPNIVRIVGYCYETVYLLVELHGKYVFAEMAERLLCLEYISSGSLDKYLSGGLPRLHWSTRYSIIRGICNGLGHLHENDIIHMDLKPANILLDDGMVPKITDFGLSRLLDQQQTINTANHNGTLGYMAPEFIREGTISRTSDIFSLGVIILEVVTAEKGCPDVTIESPDRYIEQTLEKWRKVLWRSQGYGSLESELQQIKTCITVGLFCVNPERTKRPPIAEVINMLQGLPSSSLRTAVRRRLQVC